MSDRKRIDHRAYIASLSADHRGTLLDRLIDLLPYDEALEGAEELVWLVEHIAARSPMADARVQRALRDHRACPQMPEAEQLAREAEMRAMFEVLADEHPLPAGLEDRILRQIAAEVAAERREKRREWWRSLWRRFVGRR